MRKFIAIKSWDGNRVSGALNGSAHQIQIVFAILKIEIFSQFVVQNLESLSTYLGLGLKILRKNNKYLRKNM